MPTDAEKRLRGDGTMNQIEISAIPIQLSWWQRLVCRLTRRTWNTVASTILCREYEAGVINSRQMHALSHQFDPTQSGTVGRI